MRVNKSSVLLWTAQVLLAALYIFAGSMKLILPPEAMVGPVALPTLFLRFLGVMEILGAIGLILPGLLRIRRELTPVASVGLVIIMIGATTITLMGGQVGGALVPFAAGVVAALVIYGRRDWLRAAFQGGRRGTEKATESHTSDLARHAA